MGASSWKEKTNVGVAGSATGIVTGALSCEAVAAVEFGMQLFGKYVLAESAVAGAALGCIIGPFVAWRSVSPARAALVGGACLGGIMFSVAAWVFLQGWAAAIHVAANTAFGIAGGALTGFGTAWTVREVWPWLASLSAGPPPLPLDAGDATERRYDI